MIVDGLVDGGPAAEAGLQKNDVLLEVGGETVGLREDVIDITARHAVGYELQVKAIQGGERKDFTVRLAAHPMVPDMQHYQDPRGSMADRGLHGIPDRHSDVLRDALQRNLQMLEGFNDELPGMGDDITGGMIDRLHREMSMRTMPDHAESFNSTIRLMDNEGQVELTNDGSGKHARVFDQDGPMTLVRRWPLLRRR